MITIWKCPHCGTKQEIEGKDLQEIAIKRKMLRMSGCVFCKSKLMGKAIFEAFMKRREED